MLTPNSWWKNKRTGQRMVVSTHFSSQHTRIGPRATVRHGRGCTPDRLPCLVEGRSLAPVFLTQDEVRGAWRSYRPKPDRTYIPSWMRPKKEGFDDYYIQLEGIVPEGWFGDSWNWGGWNWAKTQKTIWVSLHNREIRNGWLCLTGLDPDKQDFKGWDSALMTTFFLPASLAVPRMTPRFNEIRRDAWDRIVGEDEV